MKGTDVRIYVLLSDGECQEGSTWEAAMVAANLKLNNLVALIDHNDWGGMDRMSAGFPSLLPLGKKFEAFGWSAGEEIDGHSSSSIVDNCRGTCKEWQPWPHAIVCRTVKGKGVSFIERGQPLWHYRSPTPEEYARALEELAK